MRACAMLLARMSNMWFPSPRVVVRRAQERRSEGARSDTERQSKDDSQEVSDPGLPERRTVVTANA
jgi:hypothetical protein